MYGQLHAGLRFTVPVAFLKWTDIRNVGYQVAGNCVDDNRQGGAAELFSMSRTDLSHVVCSIGSSYFVTRIK